MGATSDPLFVMSADDSIQSCECVVSGMSDTSRDDTDRYGYSRLTDTWYILHDWDDLGDGKVRAKSKVEVPREEVPQEWIEATDERPLDTDTDQSE